MIKSIFTIAFLMFSTLISAQDNKSNDENNQKGKTDYVLKAKLGFSTLEIENFNTINGSFSEVDFVFSSKLSRKFKIDYGFGFAEFNGNTIDSNKLLPLKNTYYRIPVNVLYSSDFSSNTSIVTGIGLYGSYLAKSDIPFHFSGNNIGVNFGISFQTGLKIKVNESMDFGIMLEGQTDFNKVKHKDFDIKQKLKNTSLVSLNFVYKI